MREIKWYDCPVCGRKFNQYKFLVKDTEEGKSEACIFKNKPFYLLRTKKNRNEN